MSSTKSLVDYHERMEYNNKLNNNIKMNDKSEGPVLFYETIQEQAIDVSMVADLSNNTLNKCVTIEHPTMSSPYIQTTYSTSSSPHSDDMAINIQLLYNPNTLTELDLWDGNFHPISLHGSIEYLALDSKSIKDSLNFIAKYISNKQVSSSKSNDIEDFHGMGEAIWNFISSIYQANWDSLNADENSYTLRQKILAKFILKVPFVPSKNNKVNDKLSLASIEKISPYFCQITEGD